MTVSPYLFFNGRCEEAVEFYKKTLGAKVDMMMRWKECPQGGSEKLPPGNENKIMHASFRIGDSIVMASDGYGQGAANFQGISLSFTAKSDAEAERVFNALAEGGNVQQPLVKTFFSSRFGMLADRFGVGWMVVVGQ
jgi:PhnB protein